MRTLITWGKGHWPLGLALLLLGVVTVVINPLRQGVREDDWSYVLTVRHLLETGTYQLDNWAAANPVFQIYWGTVFARLFGFSFGSLKISTLILLAGGLCGMYFLAREHGLSARQAGLLTLILLASPYTVQYGFTFMTDVPFLATVVLGLAFYTRAIRLNSYWMALFGSIFATAAILTRSYFGVAFILGLGLVWLLKSNRRDTLRLFATAAALPMLAMVWQVLVNTETPNWAVPLHVQWQLDFVRNLPALAPRALWRLAVVLEYLALFSLMLIPVALAEWWHSVVSRPSRARDERWSRREPVIFGGVVAFLAVANVLGVYFLMPMFRERNGRWIMPLLGWSLDFLQARPYLAISLTLVMLVGAFLYARAIVLRYAGGWWRRIPDHQRLLDAVILSLLVLQLTYFQFYGRYLLPLLPFVLIVVASRAGHWLDRYAVPTVTVILALMLAEVLVVRGMYSKDEAIWAGSENLVSQGVSPEQVSSSWAWASYHGAFDNYLRAYGGHPPGENPRRPYLDDWVVNTDTALYRVTPRAQADAELRLVATIPYRDFLLRERMVYVYKRLH